MDAIHRKHNFQKNTEQDVFFADAFARVCAHHREHHAITCITKEGRHVQRWCTEDSYRYISPAQRQRLRDGYRTVRPICAFDSVQYRHIPITRRRALQMPPFVVPQMQIWTPLRLAVAQHTRGFFDLSLARAWNLSLVGAMLFGMIAMTMIYRSLGQPAFATEPSAQPVHEGVALQNTVQTRAEQPTDFATAAWELAAHNAAQSQKKTEKIISGDESHLAEDSAQFAFEKRAREMVAGYPIEEMLPEIFKLDRITAAYMIAIAKQESQWGKRVPVRDGADCYNYWGFRAVREKMGTGGHTCFDSRADAVATVGKRLHALIHTYDRTTPERLLVWKCGESCASHDQSNVRSWARTVGTYYTALIEEDRKSS